MKKQLSGIIIILVLGTFFGCDTAVNITQPTILIQTAETTVFDTIYLSVTENADIDGERVIPDYYEWKIMDRLENVIEEGFPDEKNITWVPDSAGTFIISVKIGYDGNKSITTLKEVTIKESAYSLQQKLVGSWTGTAEAMFGLTWKIDITYTQNGHYIATAYEISDDNYVATPFYYGYKYVHGQGDFAPSPDIPCQAFVIDEIINNEGYGVLWVGYEYVYGSEYSYDCNNNFEIQHLSFSNDGNNVFFSLIDYGTSYYEWYLRYNLERVD